MFWSMTPFELFSAVERWNEDNSDGYTPLSYDELEELMEMYPDG